LMLLAVSVRELAACALPWLPAMAVAA